MVAGLADEAARFQFAELARHGVARHVQRLGGVAVRQVKLPVVRSGETALQFDVKRAWAGRQGCPCLRCPHVFHELHKASVAALVALVCATVSSDGSGSGMCPPVVEYSREFQARAADELGLLPENSAVAGMMSDYAAMREQARACQP